MRLHRSLEKASKLFKINFMNATIFIMEQSKMVLEVKNIDSIMGTILLKKRD